VQDRQRRQQQRHARANNPTDDDEELQVGIAEAPTAHIAALLGASPSPAGPMAPKEPISAPSSYLQEPVLDNYPTHKPNDSPQLDSIGGDMGEGSWGGHTDEDVYGVSDGEQEARRPAVGQQDNQDDAEIAQLATRLGGQSLDPSGSPIPEREPTGSPILKLINSPILETTGSPILEPLVALFQSLPVTVSWSASLPGAPTLSGSLPGILSQSARLPRATSEGSPSSCTASGLY
jgi:hypothetical protein